MKSSVLSILFCLLILPQAVSANIITGEKLFFSTALGSNGKSCNSCHAQGQGLRNLKEYDSTVLRGLINICIEDALKGKPLAEDAQELFDMEEYIRKLGKK